MFLASVGLLCLTDVSQAQKSDAWFVLDVDCEQGLPFTHDPGTWIMALKSQGRSYSTQDTLDQSGQIVASIVTDETTGAAIPFYRSYQLCMAAKAERDTKAKTESDELRKKYQ
jgi:hypothetical protein